MSIRKYQENEREDARRAPSQGRSKADRILLNYYKTMMKKRKEFQEREKEQGRSDQSNN